MFVRGDQSVNYGVVAQVMARIKDAGFSKLSLVTEVENGG
ncbi:MAG: biopolymer transporter ExbD [Pseudomonadota bacterium]